MDFAYFVGVTTFAPNIWRTTRNKFRFMLAHYFKGQRLSIIH